MESLKQSSAPNAKVIRNGVKTDEIPSREIVPGDIVMLEAGDMIVADGRILHNYSLQVNESSLTGESTNVEKTDMVIEGKAALADRVNMVYSGSLVTYGRAQVLVTGTGMKTELGKIAGLMNAAKERKTPLQESLDKFSGRLAMSDHDNLRSSFWLMYLSQNDNSRLSVVCSCIGSSSNSGGIRLYRDYCAGVWDTENG